MTNKANTLNINSLTNVTNMTKMNRAGLQELGPQFTLKLKWLQKGYFNVNDNADYEWFLKVYIILYVYFIQRHKMETSRKKFFL